MNGRKRVGVIGWRCREVEYLVVDYGKAKQLAVFDEHRVDFAIGDGGLRLCIVDNLIYTRRLAHERGNEGNGLAIDVATLQIHVAKTSQMFRIFMRVLNQADAHIVLVHVHIVLPVVAAGVVWVSPVPIKPSKISGSSWS